MIKATLIRINFVPEHYSKNCGCVIPEAYEGTVKSYCSFSKTYTYSKILGGSNEEIIQIAKDNGINVSKIKSEIV